MAVILLDKNPTLADEAVNISVTGLAPFQKVSLHAWTQNDNGAAFESLGQYEADGSGSIHLSKSKSYGGTYTGVWAMGLISSIVPSSLNKRKYERFLITDPMKPFSFRLRLYNDFVQDLDSIHNLGVEHVLAETEIIRTYAAPQVWEEDIHVGRIRGILYYPDNVSVCPGIISISGAYPGAMKHKASLLASHGYVALALKYFGTDDLPEQYDSLDLSYFEEAAMFLKNHPRVDGRKGVGIIANCIASSIALYLSSWVPNGLIGCVVAISGWYLPYATYTYKGKEVHLSEMTERSMITEPDGTVIIETTINLSDWRNCRSEFAEFYNRLSTAYLFVYGGRDAYVPQTKQVGEVAQTLLKEAGHKRYKFLYYPSAGHLIEHAFHPHSEVLRMSALYHQQGGIRPGHNFAQEDSWPIILQFVRESLSVPQAKL